MFCKNRKGSKSIRLKALSHVEVTGLEPATFSMPLTYIHSYHYSIIYHKRLVFQRLRHSATMMISDKFWSNLDYFGLKTGHGHLAVLRKPCHVEITQREIVLVPLGFVPFHVGELIEITIKRCDLRARLGCGRGKVGIPEINVGGLHAGQGIQNAPAFG